MFFKFLVLISVLAALDATDVPRLPQPISKEVFERVLGKTLKNSCPVGASLPIWEKETATESFCRCPDGSYGITCMDGFGNPCTYNQIYHPAHPSLPPNYFIECSQSLPYLMKCAPYTEWNQEILTCDWARGAYRSSVTRARPGAPVESGYGSFISSNNKIQQSADSSYGGYAAKSAPVPVPVPVAQSQSSYGGYGSSSVAAPVPVPVPVAQSQSSYGGYGSSSVTAPVPSPLAQSSYNTDQSALTQSQSIYGSYGTNNVDQSLLSQSSYSANSYARPVSTPPPITQSSYNNDQSQLAQSQSSYGGYGDSSLVQAQPQPSLSLPVPTPVPVAPVKQSFNNKVNSYGASALQQQAQSYSADTTADQSSILAQDQSFGGSYGSSLSVAPVTAPIQSIKQSSSSYDSTNFGGPADLSSFNVMSNLEAITQKQQVGTVVKSVSNGHKMLVQSFDKPNVNIVAPITAAVAPIASTVAPIASAVAPTVSGLVPQTVDLKHPENFISFFHQVIEPKLQAKSAHPTITSTGPLTSGSGELIRLLEPIVSTQQVSPTQQHFQFDIPFAKGSGSDPNCKIPNGATVGISFTFF